MVVIGMLHIRNNPADVKKAYPFAAVAKMEGINFIYFSFENIDFKDLKINGWIYEDRKWIARQVDFPTVIINSCNPKTKKQAEILKKLKEMAIFTSHPVGNKIKVYEKVLKGRKFAKHLIQSMTVKSSSDVILFLENHPHGVIKPLKGNHGKKILFITKQSERFQLIDGTMVLNFNQNEFESTIAQILADEKYLIQPFVECKTKSGLTYDFRLHVTKNGTGEWEITLIYPRVSGNSKLISNISNGGYRGELLPFLNEEFGEDATKIRRHLEEFALLFSTHFDTLYEHPFDELGIDVGIDHKKRLWLFEVNWRPGSKNREFDVAKSLIPYCRFLANETI
jgi:glutathione synthase/RimK-type ligase-like ATP-grasp enzyme